MLCDLQDPAAAQPWSGQVCKQTPNKIRSFSGPSLHLDDTTILSMLMAQLTRTEVQASCVHVTCGVWLSAAQLMMRLCPDMQYSTPDDTSRRIGAECSAMKCYLNLSTLCVSNSSQTVL